MQEEQAVKYLNIGLIGLLLTLQFALWASDKNAFDLYHLSNMAEQTNEEIVTLTARNDHLLAKILDLKNGGQAIETLAREELGFIKADETFYQVIAE